MSDEVSSWMKNAEVNYEKWWWTSSNEILTLLYLENRFSTVLRSIRTLSFILLFQTRFGQNAERRRTRCRSLHPTKVHRLQPTYRRQGTVFLEKKTIIRVSGQVFHPDQLLWCRSRHRRYVEVEHHLRYLRRSPPNGRIWWFHLPTRPRKRSCQVNSAFLHFKWNKRKRPTTIQRSRLWFFQNRNRLFSFSFDRSFNLTSSLIWDLSFLNRLRLERECPQRNYASPLIPP